MWAVMEDEAGEMDGVRFLDNGESPKGNKLQETRPAFQNKILPAVVG